MNKLKQNLIEAAPCVLPPLGMAVLGLTLIYGGAGWFTGLLCFGLVLLCRHFFSGIGNDLFTPYILLLLSPLLLIHYSSMADFRIRVVTLVLLLVIFCAAYGGNKKQFNFSLTTAKPVTVWLMAFLIFGLAAVVLHVQGVGLSGDEPHYLMISQSVINDGDFDLKNNFEEKTYFAYLPVELRFHGGEYNGKLLSFHLPGLSFLLLPFYWIYQWVGGFVPAALYFRLAAALLNAFFALCLFYVLKHTFPQKKITGFWLFFLAIFPLSFHSVHLFPELPAATFMMGAYLAMLGKKKHYWVAGLCLGLVPWFHVKYIPPLVVLTLWILFQWWGRFKPFSVINSLDKEKVKNLFAFFLVPVLSLVLLVIYCKTLYGSFSPTDIFPKENYWGVPWWLRLKVFLAYFLDQRDGLLFYCPLFFLFFFSFKKRFTGKNVLLGMAGIYLFFHAFTTVRGAYSPAGRPVMFISWILILFMAHFYFNVMNLINTKGTVEYRRFRVLVRVLVGLSLFVSVWLFYYPLFVYQPVVAETVERASSFNLFWGSDNITLWRFFPSFLTAPATSHPATYIWIALLLVLMGIYYFKPFKPMTQTLSTSSKSIVMVLLLFLGFSFLYCFYAHVALRNDKKYTDKIISFYNNSGNFIYQPDSKGFRIKAGNTYDIFIDRDLKLSERVTFVFSDTESCQVILRNGRKILFQSWGQKREVFTFALSTLSMVKVKNKWVSHIGFETSILKQTGATTFLWLEIQKP